MPRQPLGVVEAAVRHANRNHLPKHIRRCALARRGKRADHERSVSGLRHTLIPVTQSPPALEDGDAAVGADLLESRL